MDGNHQRHVQQFRCQPGIFGPHGVVVPDGQQGRIDGFQPGQKGHIPEHTGVSGEIHGFPAKFHNESAGVPSGNAAAVESRSHPHPAEGEGMGAPQVHGVGPEPVGRRIVGDFRGGNDQGAIGFGDFVSRSQMVSVVMGNKDHVRFQVLRLQSFRVPFQVRIEQQGGFSVTQGETGMMDVMELQHGRFLLIR